MPESPTVPVLWFDSKGCGPDEFNIQIHPIPPDMGGKIPAHLGLRIRAGSLVIVGAALIDGGFYLDRESVAGLHLQLGAWLGDNPAVPPEVMRGLRLIRRHFAEDGHEWTEGTEWDDVQAALTWIDERPRAP